jgi:hypothetical protein
MSQQAQELRIAKTLLPLVIEAAEATEKLRHWRAEAGPESKWSNHVRLAEAEMFSKTEAKYTSLGEHLRAEIPQHWQMEDWSFKLDRDVLRARWAANGGTSYFRCITIPAQKNDLIYSVGALIGAITRSNRPLQADIRKMSQIGLSPSNINAFSIRSHSRPLSSFFDAPGHHPQDACAFLIAQGTIKTPPPPKKDLQSSPEAVFKAGIECSDLALRQSYDWSAAPLLLRRLRRDHRSEALAGPAPYILSPYTIPMWENKNREKIDITLAAAHGLLNSLPEKPGKLRPFTLLKGSQPATTIYGWCPTSAILGEILRALDAEEFPSGFDEWKIFSQGDEVGDPARKIARQILHP